MPTNFDFVGAALNHHNMSHAAAPTICLCLACRSSLTTRAAGTAFFFPAHSHPCKGRSAVHCPVWQLLLVYFFEPGLLFAAGGQSIAALVG